jgi:uncharacterized membrane protein YgcG
MCRGSDEVVSDCGRLGCVIDPAVRGRKQNATRLEAISCGGRVSVRAVLYLWDLPRCWVIASTLALSMLGCVGDTQFNVQYAPGANRKGARISVFGIKRDGLLSPSGWDALSHELSAPFGAKRCAVAYSDDLISSHALLAEALDSYVRENGVTDELLNKLAPAAQGDTILLVTSAGRPRSASNNSAGAGRGGPGGGRGMGGGGGRGMGMGGGGRRGGGSPGIQSLSSDTADHAEDYQLTAMFFSVAEHKTVGLIELSYSGTSSEQAIAAFRSRLESEFSGAACSGWRFSPDIDPNEIRKLASQ